MEYWSIEMMDENWTTVCHPDHKAKCDLIICVLEVSGQKRFRNVVQIIVTILICQSMLLPFLHHSTTPVYQWLKSRALLGANQSLAFRALVDY
jgi:hypothetical protein